MEKFGRKALFPCRKIPHGNSPFHRCNGPLVEIRRPIWYTEPEKGERSMTFGEKVQALRRARGWTQEQLAEQIGVSRQSLSKWESNSAAPDTERVVALSRLFCVTTDYLLLEEASGGAHLAAPVQPPPDKGTRHRRVRRLVGGLMAGCSAAGFLVLGILSSVFPCYKDYKTELSIFLEEHRLEWFFHLLIAVLIAGLLTAFWSELKVQCREIHEYLYFCIHGNGQERDN